MTDFYGLKELKIEINRDCPLNCIHCSSNGEHGAPEQLTYGQVSKVIDEFAGMGGKEVCISGGEPLVYSNIAKVINKCSEVKIAATIYTSGIMSINGLPKPISNEMVDLLAANSVKVVFSIHGASNRIHEALTQTKGSYTATIEAIERTKRAHLQVESHVVPTALNFSTLKPLIKLISSFGIQKISLLRFVPQGRGKLNRSILQLNKEQLEQLGEKITDLRQTFPNISIRTGAPYNILCPELPAKCEAGIGLLVIKPDGTTAPCDAFKRFKFTDDFGDIARASLSDIWHNSKFLNKIRALKISESKSTCSSCLLFDRCNSGCLAQKSIASGKLISGRDPECPLARACVENAEQEAILV